MDFVCWKNYLNNLYFQFTFACLPIQPIVFFIYRVDTFKKLSDQKLPRDQKNDQIFCFSLLLHILIGTLGSDILNVGALSYSEVLAKAYSLA